MEIEFDATQAMESRRNRAEETRRALQDEIDAADAAIGIEPNEETAQALREAGEGKNLMGPYATADEMFDAFGLD